MTKLTKRTVDTTENRSADYVIWDEELPGFGLRVFASGRYIHTVDTALITAADSNAGYIQGLLGGVAFTHTAYALDRDSRKSALANFLGEPTPGGRANERSAA